jgi:hypothetical protein
MVAMFESSSTKKTGKDPAELPLSERRAMFERKGGQALFPKAALSMPVPAKYLTGHSDGQRNVSNKVLSPASAYRTVGSIVTQWQGSVTADNNPKKISRSGQQSGCVVKQANGSKVAEVATSRTVSVLANVLRFVRTGLHICVNVLHFLVSKHFSWILFL